MTSTEAAGPSLSAANVGGAYAAAPTTRRSSREYALHRLLAAADICAVLTGLGAAGLGAGGSTRHLAWGLVSLPLWVLVFKVYGLYDRDAKRVSHSTVDDIPWLFHALVIGSIALWLLVRLAPVARPTYGQGVTFFAAAFGAAVVYRAVARYCARRALTPERVVFVGCGSMAAVLIEKIRLHPEYRLEPVGYVDVGGDGRSLARDLPYLGTAADLESACAAVAADRVVVVSSELSSDVVVDTIRLTKGLDLRVSVLPSSADVLGPSLEIDDLEGITILGINPPALTRSSRLLKRGLDLGVASLVLVLLLPLIGLIALLVRASSPGPVFFLQERVGQGGRRFRMLKFRTMVADAEARVESLRAYSAHPVWLLLERDPRITSVGRILRRYSLDELPQLWNVLRGDMSLVGPRPMPPEVDEQIQGWGRRRLDLTPGVTGLWQVLGRTTISFEEMVKLDYLYVTNWSLWQDVRLLIRTLPAVLSRRGAN